jgi:hypothetical protein
MTSTSDTRDDLREYDATAVLEAVTRERRTADRAEARLLDLAVHWVDLHPVTEEHQAATPQHAGGLFGGPDVRPALAGKGTPGIAEFAVEELAAALGIGYQSGFRLCEEAVELCFRLPRLWALVQAGRLQAWKGRQVARETKHLSREAVAFVDRHVATLARRNRLPLLRAVVHEARLQCDPDQADAVEQVALERRGVWFDHRESTATTQVTARLDTLDALDLQQSVADLATVMGRLGDTRPVDVRQAGALGMLAQPQRALDLVAGQPGAADQPALAEHVTSGGLNGSRGTLYLHVSADDLATHLTTRAGGGSVERLGAATLQLLRDWLLRMCTVSVRPVLDLDRSDAVDVHDPPGWMRELVVLRDEHCVFPGCGVDARACDLDHVEAYVSPDDGGPPGQTSPANLACLCRRHHRLKTFTSWSYRRRADATYLWTGPGGRTYS